MIPVTIWWSRWSATCDELRAKLDEMHPADVAYILELLPLDERLLVWDLVKTERDGDILLEVSDAVRESLIKSMDPEELVAATEQLEADDISPTWRPTCRTTSWPTCSRRCRSRSASSA